MREVLERVAQLQPQWSHKNTPEMQERGQLIRHTGPDWLRGFSAELADAIGIPLEDLIIEGRDGTGPKTEVPWFRYGSRVRSPSATIGWYCVYLFSTDGSTIYLSLGRGSTEWNGIEFKPRDHDELRTQAAWARSAAGGTPADMVDTIDLQSRRSNLGPSYEAGTVFALEYGADSIPGSAQLRADAIRVGRLLGTLYKAEDDPGAPGLPPEVREAVDTAATTAGKAATLSSSAGFRPNAEQRKAIELRGMEVVRAALVDWGWSTVSDTSANKPYDFHCTDGDDELFVEVKATTSDGAIVILTRNEVEHVRSRHPDTALAVVSRIVPPKGDSEPAAGGSLAFLHPWQVSDSDLSVISYLYGVPTEAVEVWS